MNSMLNDIDDMFEEAFPERLRELRISAKLKQQELADELGISVAALSYYETGKRIPDIVFLMKISEYFNVPVDYFLGYTNSIKRENVYISNSLRISDKAIEKIRAFIDDSYENTYYYLENCDILNMLLESDDFYSVLNMLTWGGAESCEYIPDESYISFLAMKKLTKTINDIIENVPPLKERVIEAVYPEQEERLKFVKWLAERSENNIEELKKRREEEMKKLSVEIQKDVDEYRSIRSKAVKNIEEAAENGKHNPKKE